MQVRGVGRLGFLVEEVDSSKGCLCVIGSFNPPIDDDIPGWTVLKMNLYPNEGLDSERFDQILQEAKYEDTLGTTSLKAPNVIVKEVHNVEGRPRKILDIECGGHVADIEGVMKRVASILRKAAKTVDA